MMSQLLPGNGLRVFFIADQNNGWTFREVQYLDIFPDSLSPVSGPVSISTPNGFINYFVGEAYILRMADGSSIIADNFFDCDYGHAGSIYRLGASGNVEWWYDLVDEFGVYDLVGMGYVDENIIGMDTWSSLFRLTIQGIPIFESKSSRVPEHSIQTPFGYLLSYFDSLEIRNTSFELIASYILEGNIIGIEPIDLDSYRIRTSQKFYELNPQLELLYVPLGLHSVWSSPTAYWQYDTEIKAVVQYDTSFTIQDTLPLSPGVRPYTGTSLEDKVVTLCFYENDISRGIVSYIDPDHEVHFDLVQDIGISEMVLPDLVLAEFYNSTVPWAGWSYTYEWVDAYVTNFGTSEVSQFYIQGHDVLDCFWWCYAPVPFWKIDTLLLLPGESAWVRLPGFTTRCDWDSFDPTLCLSTIAPNDRADGDYRNDRKCESFDFVLPYESPLPPASASVYPNPASETVNVMADPGMPDYFTINVFNTAGVEVRSVQGAKSITTIPVDDLAEGLYFITVPAPSGWNIISKLAVIR